MESKYEPLKFTRRAQSNNAHKTPIRSNPEIGLTRAAQGQVKVSIRHNAHNLNRSGRLNTKTSKSGFLQISRM